ncbi:uncharacterized protein LOC112569097 [Pomacea canaliculata]|uniref:uncharacterized protein LOC112569097 n=1 Tax=Pomacea canaliculata TaxID=400727 RepID=UPI000D7398BA|nr:uncharacterized protein LOC112569097 [Pomacea canaliculata]
MHVALLLVFAFVGFSFACTIDSECGDDECCFIENPMIMSKRAAVAPVDSLLLPIRFTGKCTPKQDEGKSCSGMYSCGCKAGLRCQISELQLFKRVIAYLPAYCIKDTTV